MCSSDLTLVKWCLAGIAGVLVLALGLQYAYVERDRIAAYQPEAVPALEVLCEWAGCQLAPLQSIEAVVIDIKPPRVQTRNRKEDFEVNQTLWEAGELSGKEWLAAEGYERASQQAQIAQERSSEHDLPKGSPHYGAGDPTPGPDPAKKADPMAEKGVSSGNPE